MLTLLSSLMSFDIKIFQIILGVTLVEQIDCTGIHNKCAKDDLTMDTEFIESGLLSGVEGTLHKARPVIPPIKREKLEMVQKIPVPSH